MPDPIPVPAGSAYVHIPFCVRKCSYCDFCSYPGQSGEVRADYAAALIREIRAAARWAGGPEGPGRVPLETVFVGGGTPTVLTGRQLASILDELRHGFGLAADPEITLEANPGTVDAEKLERCRDAGFNRISFGLQAVQPSLLGILGRIHSADDFTRSVSLAAAAGFRSISADIMVGLPGQTLSDLDETISIVLSQPVDHVSFYSLILEDGTPLKDQCDRQPWLLPDEEAERAQYHRVVQRLAASGFVHYEISNAARPGHECRHNKVYWQALEYYGFGVAAHSYLGGIRRSNTTGLPTYLSAWAQEHPDPFAAAEVLERLDQPGIMKEAMLLGLRMTEGVSHADFQNRFGVRLMDVFGDEVGSLCARGLLTSDSAGVRLTGSGLDLANQVFMAFV